MADEEDVDKELKRLALEDARERKAERERKQRLEVERAHDQANAMRAREKNKEEQEDNKEESPKQTKEEDKEQARGRGGSLINVGFIERHTHSHFWLWVIILFALVWFLRRFDILRITLYWVMVGLFFFFILWGFYLGFKEFKTDRTKFFIAMALFVWLLDMWPENFWFIGNILGPPYAGFELPLGIWAINWPSIFFSSLVFALLYVNMVLDIIKKQALSFGLAFALIVIGNNFAARLTPYFPGFLNLNLYIPLGAIIFFIVLVGLGVWAVYRDYKYRGEIAGFFTYLYMIFAFSFFWVNNGWIGNIRAVIHAAYVIFFGFFYIKPRESPPIWHVAIPTFLIFDFFGYGFLWGTDYLWLKFIPVLVLAVIFYCYARTEDWFAILTFIVLVTVLLILSLQTYGYEATGTINFKQRSGTDFTDFFGSLAGKTKELIEGRIDIATGGLYRGNVEKNRYESLGVYFNNIRAADPRYYTDEPITVWGTIRSKTYQDAVIVNFSCYRWKGDKKIPADKTVPDFEFPIFTLEELDTQCTFLPHFGDEEKEIKPGQNTITFSAEYNFGTDAYIKAYFIDRDRFRASARENIDPLTQYGIKEKNPVPVFTNGPVEIGIEQLPLITVSEQYNIKPSIGITLTNRKEITDKDKNLITRWDGKIKNITELVLLVPPGVEISNFELCKSKDPAEKLECPCTMPFEEYTETHCKNTCSKDLFDPCRKACIEAFGDIKQNSCSNNKDCESCLGECQTTKERCEKECDFLFSTTGEENLKGKYKGYALDVGSIEFKDLNKDIDKHRSFRCRFDASQKVLDQNPVTTRYFRVRARYNYLLENSVSVSVESPRAGTLPAQETLYKAATDSIRFVETPFFTGFDPDLIIALATVESRAKHCCQEGYKGAGSTCYRSDLKKCPPERTITSGTSYGIMQIRYDKQTVRDEVDKRVKRLCPDQTIFDIECNVKVGIDILNEKRMEFENGCKESNTYKTGDRKKYVTFFNACDNCKSTDGTPYYEYKGMRAALRGYNGWGCDSRFDRGYVEKVEKVLKQVKEGIVDDATLISVLPRQGKGMIYDETLDGQQDIPLQS